MARRAALGGMAGSLSHDLASMVQGLQCSVAELEFLLADEGEIDREELAELTQDIGDVSRLLTGLFDELRGIARRTALEGGSCRLDDVVTDACRRTRSRLTAGRKLRAGSAPVREVACAAPLLRRILMALLDNAAAATPAGGAIDLEIAPQGGWVDFTVTDDGDGIDPAVEAALFDANEEADCGVWLAVVASLVEALGGSIRHDRAPGRGARFTVTMPLAHAEEQS